MTDPINDWAHRIANEVVDNEIAAELVRLGDKIGRLTRELDAARAAKEVENE